jgi:hypothetical protein
MFSQLENAIVIAALVWGAVRIIEHFAPDWWTRNNAESRSSRMAAIEDRLDAIETELKAAKEVK